jgi:hypothetical protein
MWFRYALIPGNDAHWKAFECVNILARGLQNILIGNPMTLDYFYSTEFRKKSTNLSYYQNISYSGIISDPVILNNQGQLSLYVNIYPVYCRESTDFLILIAI